MPEAVAAIAPARRSRRARPLLAGLALGAGRGLGVLAQTAVQLAVAALGGTQSLGLLQLLTSWTGFLGEVLGAGYPSRAMRDVAILQEHGAGPGIRRLLRRAGAQILMLAAAFAPVAGALLLFAASRRAAAALAFAVVLAAPLFALTRLCSEALKALGRPLLAVSAENLAAPLAVLALCAVLALGQRMLPATLLVAATLAGMLTGLLLLGVRLRAVLAALPECGKAGCPDSVTTGREQLRLWGVSLLNIAFLQLPFFLLPLFADVAAVGHYAVAHKLLNIITTLLILLAAIYGPRFARSAATADAASQRRLLQQTQLLSLGIFLPAAAALLLAAEPLARLFSLPPHSLPALLSVLAAGQLVNAATGLAGVLLNMSGAARLELRILLAALVLTTLAALLLGARHGALGVAIAASGGIALRNLASYTVALRRIPQTGQAS